MRTRRLLAIALLALLVLPALGGRNRSSAPAVKMRIDLGTIPDGVAPYYVFLDGTASATDQLAGDDGFFDLHYEWNWDLTGVSDGGTWSDGSSKELSYGPVAAHVYETPGTYYIRATVTTSLGKHDSNDRTVKVLDPNVVWAGTKTLCVSRADNWTDCPVATAQHVHGTGDWYQIVALLNGTGGKRVLLRAGETWAAAAPTAIDTNITGTTGPTLLGAYGSGAKPLVEYEAGQLLLHTNQAADFRLVGLEFHGETGNNAGRVLYAEHAVSHILVLDCEFHEGGSAIMFNGSTQHFYGTHGTEEHPHHYIGVVDSVVNVNENGIWILGDHVAVLGNAVTPGNFSGNPPHGIRSAWASPAVYQHNSIAATQENRVGMKLHAPAFTLQWGSGLNGIVEFAEGGVYTEKVIVSDNVFTDTSVWVDPQNDGHLLPNCNTCYGGDERLRKILVERNQFLTTPVYNGQVFGLYITAENSVVRNNIAHLTLDSTAPAFYVFRRSPDGGPSKDVRVYNNTCVLDGPSPVTCVDLHEGTKLLARNNGLYAPGVAVGNVVKVAVAAESELQNDHNLVVISADPGDVPIVDATPTMPADFVAKVGEAFHDTGSSSVGLIPGASILESFDASLRDGTMDVGAWAAD